MNVCTFEEKNKNNLKYLFGSTYSYYIFIPKYNNRKLHGLLFYF